MLDWVEKPTFLADLEALASPAPCRIPSGALYLPRGRGDHREARLDSFGRKVIPSSTAWNELRRWWLRHPRGANTPNWDIAVGCEVSGQPGLLLVEAKANVPELSGAGKAAFRASSKCTATCEQRSRENAEHIRFAIEVARKGLAPMLPGINISRDTHYQLSNRLAFAWKLARCGIPTVLIYLGFIADRGLREPLTDPEHWNGLFRSHVSAVCSAGIPEGPHVVGPAEFWVLCRSRRVMSDSPTADTAKAKQPERKLKTTEPDRGGDMGGRHRADVDISNAVGSSGSTGPQER